MNEETNPFSKMTKHMTSQTKHKHIQKKTDRKKTKKKTNTYHHSTNSEDDGEDET